MSDCKEKYRFSCEEWEMQVVDRYLGDNLYSTHWLLTKKKPKAKLEWSPIEFDSETTMQSLLGDYRLVRFRITGVNARTYYINSLCQIEWWLKRNQSWSTYFVNNTLKLAIERNEWSSPVVIPIDFYNKLDCYVAEFNNKLQGDCYVAEFNNKLQGEC